MLRTRPGEAPTTKAQKAAATAHQAVCKMRNVGIAPRVISPPLPKRRRWRWLTALIAVVALLWRWLKPDTSRRC